MEKEEHKYNFSQTWVTKAIVSKWPFFIKNPFLSVVIKFGLILIFVFTIFYLVRHEYISTKFLIAEICALFWISIIGPYLIYFYNEKLLPTFFSKLSDILPNDEELKLLVEKYNKIFPRIYKILFVLSFFLFIVGNILTPIHSPNIGSGLFGLSDPWHWILMIVSFWLVLLAANGISAIITTMIVIKEISKETISLDPLPANNVGELGCVSYYATRTVIMVSSGSLLLPWALLSPNVKIIELLSYSIVIFYSLFILLSFLYPIIKMYKKANSVRNEILNALKKRYNDLDHKLESINQNPPNADTYYYEYRIREELQRIKEKYLFYEDMKLYFFNIEIFVRLTLSVMSPTILFLIQKSIS